jgi:hypothetical protein
MPERAVAVCAEHQGNVREEAEPTREVPLGIRRLGQRRPGNTSAQRGAGRCFNYQSCWFRIQVRTVCGDRLSSDATWATVMSTGHSRSAGVRCPNQLRMSATGRPMVVSSGQGVGNRSEPVLRLHRASHPRQSYRAMAREAIGWSAKEPFVSALSQRLSLAWQQLAIRFLAALASGCHDFLVGCAGESGRGGHVLSTVMADLQTRE